MFTGARDLFMPLMSAGIQAYAGGMQGPSIGAEMLTRTALPVMMSALTPTTN